MEKLMKPFLIFSLLFLSSCTNYLFQGYHRIKAQASTYQNSFFSDQRNDYIYKTRVSAYGNELTGILIVKKLDDTLHRVVLATEFGSKLLDVEVSENSFTVNSIVEEINKKM
ncbi:MAG: hypothetical protein EOP48_26245, partial [Sphingobacteriales bacterium]